MGRIVTAVVTHGGVCAGVVGPFPVEVPWWAEVEPVVTYLEQTLGVPVVVLRLLAVEGADGARDGYVTYHAEALQPPRNLPRREFVDDDHPLRQPWARASGVRELFRWAARHVHLTGRPVQRKTWNLAGLFRLPTADGPVWLKAIPAFAAAEPAAIAAFAQVDPDLVPTVLASGPGRLLLSDVPGTDCWDASPQVVTDAVHRLATAQARIGRPPDNLPDRRPETLAAAVHDLLDGPVGAELSPAELRAAESLQSRWEMLDRRTAGAFRVRRALPGVPRQHRTQRTRLPSGRPGVGDPPGDCLRAGRGWFSRRRRRQGRVDVIRWLLDSDPAIRWQVMRDLADAPEDLVAAERARVASEGWGARLLALQQPDGQWPAGIPAFSSEAAEKWWHSLGPARQGTLMPAWTSTAWTLTLLRAFGLDPDSAAARQAVGLVHGNVQWEHDAEPFFAGEVEPCINGRTVALGAYFGVDVAAIVRRLLGEQMADGGWNCEQENGSARGSFNTTIDVLEGLLEYERAVGTAPGVTKARLRGQEYLLRRRMFRRLSTGQPIDTDRKTSGPAAWTQFSYPTFWRYDVLRGLDYLRAAGATPDDRVAEAIELVRAKPDADGRWPLENPHPGKLHFAIDDGEGKPSRWNTLRAMRVLRWYGGGRETAGHR